jgi:cell wall-associated protease
LKKTRIQMTSLAIALAATAMLSAPKAHAVPIAVIDSGTDLGHPDLINHQWVNIYDWEDGVDNDDNGYIDDTHGWNFGDNNNKLYNKKLVGTWSKDIYKFFDVQTRVLKGTATPEDIAWMKSIRNNTAFIAQLENFGNWVHGTHVAGISSRDAVGAEVMPLKFIATQGSSYLSQLLDASAPTAPAAPANDDAKNKLIKLALGALGSAQGTALAPIGKYANMEGARVANCSFGSSATQIKTLIGPLIEKVLGHPLTEDQLDAWAVYFMSKASDSMRDQFINASPNTLFVIAAGNDGTNNDLMPAVPANVRTANTITVAATNGLSTIASFSNYGVQNVDIAAPGVGILSSIPGDDHLTLSGTSQATPFVTNVVGRIMDMNPALTIPQVKEVLFGTVDRKAFLQGKVATGGIANPTRALRATSLMLSGQAMDVAITQARVEVPDMPEQDHLSVVMSSDVYVTPLMPLLR